VSLIFFGANNANAVVISNTLLAHDYGGGNPGTATASTQATIMKKECLIQASTTHKKTPVNDRRFCFCPLAS